MFNGSYFLEQNVKKRFQAIDFEVIEIDGHNFEQIDKALVAAKSSTLPVLIIAKTAIAKGAVTMEGSHHAHGAPLGNDEIAASMGRPSAAAARMLVGRGLAQLAEAMQ